MTGARSRIVGAVPLEARHGIVLVAACWILAVVSACRDDFEPPPDVDTSGDSGSDGAEGDDGSVVHDGLGLGAVVPARAWSPASVEDVILRDHMLVMAAPEESWGQTSRSGQISILLSSLNDAGLPAEVLVRPTEVPHTIVEDLHASACEDDQQFAWDRLPGRQLGASLSFFHREVFDGAGKYEHALLAAAPRAGSDSGRVMGYLRCRSCALFPKPNGETAVIAGQFGAAIGVGFFAPGQERLVVGAPRLGGGAVAIIEEFARWDAPSVAGTVDGTRECQCGWSDNYPYNVDCAGWAETLHGSYGEAEEFGAALAIADLNCDGYDDLVVGAPGADLPTMDEPIVDAGAVYVYMNAGGDFSGVAPTVLHQSSLEVGGEAEAGERFGAVLTVGNFNGARREGNERSCFDLVVGVPNEGDGAGQIQVFEGSPSGLVYGGPVIDLDDIFDASADPGDHFGWALVGGDLNRDRYDDLVIGAPNDMSGGSVSIVPGSSAGLALDNATYFRQNGEVPGDNIAGDEYGASLTWTQLGFGTGNAFFVLAVGAPGENGGTGAVNVYRVAKMGKTMLLTAATIITQGMILGDEMSGDRFGQVLLGPRAVPELVGE